MKKIMPNNCKEKITAANALLLVIVLLVTAATTAFAQSNTIPSISAAYTEYVVGGQVHIKLDNIYDSLHNYEVIILTQKKTYKYNGPLYSTIVFYPIEAAEHHVALISKGTQQPVATTFFNARDASPGNPSTEALVKPFGSVREAITAPEKTEDLPESSSKEAITKMPTGSGMIWTDKAEYFLYEEVTARIELSPEDEKIYGLYYEYEGFIQRYFGNYSKITFHPKGVGTHKLIIKDKAGNAELSHAITVAAINTSQKTTAALPTRTELTIEGTQAIPIKIQEDYSLQEAKLSAKIKVRDSKGFEEGTKVIIQESTQEHGKIISDAATTTTHEIEFNFLKKPIKQLVIETSNLISFEQNQAMASIGVDFVRAENIELPPVEAEQGSGLASKKILKAYAIDPTQLNFTAGRATTIAKGTQLWKCKEWLFEQSTCIGEWVKHQNIIPGQEYDIILSPSDPGYAETGIVTVNTNKSTYHPGEQAKIIVAVLDKSGSLVSNADLTLFVTKPNNQTTVYSTRTGYLQEASYGIYEQTFSDTTLEGDYGLRIMVKGNNATLEDNEMESFFLVRQYFDYDIIRSVPASIDPFSGPFESKILLVSYLTQESVVLEERIPKEFKIINSGGAFVTNDGTSQTLTWYGVYSNTEVSYIVQAPLLSPELWLIGPASVTSALGTYDEAKPWFLAADPSAQSMPTNYSDPDSLAANPANAYDSNHSTSAVYDIDGSPTTKYTTYTQFNISSINNNSVLSGFNITYDFSTTGTFSNDQWLLQYTNNSGSTWFTCRSGSTSAARQNGTCVLNSTGWTVQTFANNFQVRVGGNRVGSADGVDLNVFEIWATLNYTPPNIVPTPLNVAKNASSVYANNTVTFNATWTDADGNLTTWIFSWNITGTWVNDTPRAFTSNNVSNVSKLANGSIGALVGWLFYANDSSGGFNSTPLQTFTILGPDTTPPTIWSQNVTPSSGVSGTSFNITANITDNQAVQSATMQLSLPNSTSSNYTMSLSGGTIYAYLFNSTFGGNFSFTIYATDGTNTNHSNRTTRFNVTASISVGKLFYQRGDRVDIAGAGFSPAKNVTIYVKNLSGSIISGYPLNTTSNSTGGIYTNWNISSALSFPAGDYIIEAVDTVNTWLNSSANLTVIIKPATATILTDDPSAGGSSPGTIVMEVLSKVNDTDNLYTNIVSSTVEVYLETNFSNLIPAGYQVTSARIYFEHFELSNTNTTVKWRNTTSGSWITICNIANSSAEIVSSCNLSAVIKNSSDANSIALRFSDNNLGTNNVNWTMIDFVYLDLTFKESSELVIFINNPKATTRLYNYSSSTNKAYHGSTTLLPPTSIQTGTEFTSNAYNNITISDDIRTRSTVTGSGGLRAYQSFKFVVEESSQDISSITFNYEGHANKTTSQTGDTYYIYVWNFSSIAYNLLATVPQQFDAFTSINLPGNNSNLINSSNGEIFFLIEGDHSTGGGPNAQADIYTDFANLNVSKTPILTGNQLINATAIDSDGVLACNYYYRFINGTISGLVYPMLNNTNNLWTNTSNTQLYSDGFFNLFVNCTDTPLTSSANASILVKIANTVPTIRLITPQDTDNLTYSNINFTWNATSVNPGVLFCNLTIDAIVREVDVSSPNGQEITRNWTLSNGVHYWNVTCRDTAGLSNTSSTRSIDIDTIAPTIALTYPGANLWISTSNILFNYTPSDSHNLRNCSIFIRSSINQTDSTPAVNQPNYFNVTNFAEGFYNWSVTCTDTYSWIGNSSIRNFTIDRTSPAIIISYPPDGQNFTGGNVTFNFTVTDNIDTSLTCNLTIDGAVSQVHRNFAAANSSLTSKTESGIPDGFHVWNITCWDDAFNLNTSIARNFTMTGGPLIQLLSPANDAWLNYANLTFRYYVADGDGIANCSIYLDNTLNQTTYTTNITNPGNNTFNISNISQGSHNWTVYCIDLLGTPSEASQINFTVDTQKPQITLLEPLPNQTLFNSSVKFNFTATDNLDPILVCNLSLDDVVSSTNRNFNASNGSTINLTENSVSEGIHYWNITCRDDAGNFNTSTTRNFTIDNPPVIFLLTPPNNAKRQQNITFTYNVSDISGIANCSLIFNGVLNQTRYSTNITNPGNNSFNLTDISEGLHNWAVMCADNGGQSSQPLAFNVTVDSTAPSVTARLPNGTLTSNNTVTFNFTASDAVSASLNCTVSVNAGNYTNSTIANNATETSVRISGINDGLHNWNVTCRDEAGNIGTSNTLNFTVDSSPIVSLDRPLNGNASSISNVTFTYLIYESSLSNCSLIINSLVNQTRNTSEIPHISDGITNNFSINSMTEGTYNWTVICFDTNGFNGTEPARTLYVDTTPPYNVTLHYPLQNETLFTSNIIFNWTAFDNIGPNLSCDLIINNAINKSNVTSAKNQSTTTVVSGFTPGNYTWSVNCTDLAGFNANSTTRSFNISSQVVVTINNPQNNTYDGDGNVTFFFVPKSIAGFSTTGTCELYVNGESNETLVTPINNAQNNISIYNMGQSSHSWYVNCTDDNFNFGVSETRTLIVDLTDPTVIINYPIAQTINVSFVNFNWTAIDNLDQNLACNITVNGTIIASNINSPNATATNRTVFNFNDNLHFWNVTCADDSGRVNTSTTQNFTIAEPPTVRLLLPINNSRNSTTTVVAYYNATDNSGTINNCTLILNNANNQTNTTVTSGARHNFSISALQNGTYAWDVNCTDPSGNTAANATPLIFHVDLFGPAITLRDPSEGQVFNSNNITFNWTAVDFNSTILLNCSIFATDTPSNRSASSITGLSGSNFQHNFTALADGQHAWNVTCVDDLGNIGISSTGNFTINQPDLYIDDGRIAFNNTNPNENQTLNITANVSNIGGNDANNVLVTFWDGLPGEGGVQIGNTSGNVATGAFKIFSILWNITLGIHNIHVTIDPENLIAELNASNNNATKNISILRALINSPANNTITQNPNASINFTVEDFTGLSINYTVFINAVQSANGTSTDNQSTTYNTTLPQGINRIIVQASDLLGRRKNSSITFITADFTPPAGTINTANNTWFNFSNPQINISATDNIFTNLNYTIFVNGTVDASGFINNGTSLLVNITSRPDGLYNLIMQTIDGANNTHNTTQKTIYIDTTKPEIILNSPDNTSNITATTVLVNFTALDNLASFMLCNVTLDSVLQPGLNVSNGNSATYNLTNLTEGPHYWNVTCLDQARIFNVSENRIINIFKAPVIQLISPANNSISNNATQLLQFNATDDTGLENCTLILNGALNQTRLSSELINGGTSNFTLNNLNGTYTWAVTCHDNTSLYMQNTSITRLFIVDLDPPQPRILTANQTWFNTPSPQIRFNITDNYDTNINFTVFANGVNNTNGSVLNATLGLATLQGLSPDGNFEIIVQATDDAPNSANSTPITIYVDTTVPAINSIHPANGASFNSTSVQFNFTPSDNMAPALACNLTVSSGFNELNINSSSSSNVSINKTGFSAGTYYWNVTCTDLAGNRNTSATLNFTINAPDLVITTANITFNHSGFEEGQNITIYANVLNTRGIPATNITIQFWRGNPDTGGSQIGQNITVTTLANGENSTVSTYYTPIIGLNNIFVAVDPPTLTNGSIVEQNESNNLANNSFEVGLYQVYAGNLSGRINIEKQSVNFTLFNWSVSNLSNSYIFVSDLEGNVNFLRLQALGRNTTNGSSPGTSNDFAEIDNRIGTTNLSDSVNKTYTSSGQPQATLNLTIFERSILNIPVVNSTNSTVFMTGILWDTSDGGIEYNASQDIVFINPVVQSGLGSRGNYDFEIAVPAYLRNYNAAGTSVAFYTELR